MQGRTPAEAVQRYLDRVQLIISCITDRVVDNFGGYTPSPLPHPLFLGDGQPVRLTPRSQVAFGLRQRYLIDSIESAHADERWQIRLTSYMYWFTTLNGAELLAYHRHPIGDSPITFPHLHLGAGAQVGHEQVAQAHLPSGTITLADVIQLAIRDLGVEPRRNDWETILSQGDSA